MNANRIINSWKMQTCTKIEHLFKGDQFNTGTANAQHDARLKHLQDDFKKFAGDDIIFPLEIAQRIVSISYQF